MKSYNGLFDRMTQLEEVKNAILSASKHKRHRRSVRKVLANIEPESARIQRMLLDEMYRPPNHEKKNLREGPHRKERRIEKPWFRDEQIIHHLLIRQLKPILTPRMYRHSYGSLPERGALKAQQVMTRWCREYGKKKFYVAELDIHKFYASIQTEILKEMLAHYIRDQLYLRLMYRVIDAAAPGLPLGFYTSPWLGHLYFLKADNFVLQDLNPDHYMRYMDNLFILHRNKRELRCMVQRLSAFLKKYNLRFNGSAQIYRFEYQNREGETAGRAINCLGYVIHRNRVTLRKSILHRARAKANRMSKHRRLRVIDATSMISRCGWFRHTDTYGYFQRWIKPKVSVRACRKRISAQKRKEQKHDRLENRTRGQGP